MNALIYLLVFIATYIFSFVLVEAIIPAFAKKWGSWQEKRVDKVVDKLEDSFIFLEKKKLVLISVCPLIFAGAFFILFQSVIGLIVGFFLGLAFPGFASNFIKQRRLKQFTAQLVDSMMILSSSLKGGLSLIQAIEVLCEEMPPPVSQEFNLILKENKWGVSLEDSMRKLRVRMPIEEVNLLVSSVLVARETGGELTRVFSRLVDRRRKKIKFKKKNATLTLQGRMQGVIMSILPIGFALFISKQQPDHFDVMWSSEQGRMLLIAAVIAQILAIFLIKKISTLRV